MHKIVRQAAQWVISGILSLVICNGLLFLYNKPAGRIDRTNSSTNSIWRPGSYLLLGTEGRGYYTIDKNGYVNDDLPLQGGYCVVVGASYTQGKEVAGGKRYTDLLNEKIAGDQEVLAVYNCSQDGYYFPEIVKNFYAITQEFVDAETIVIEISSTDFSKDELENSLEQGGFDELQLGKNIEKSLSVREKIKVRLKEALPIYTMFRKQIVAYHRNKISSDVEDDTSQSYYAGQRMLLENALTLIRSEWDKDLIIMYHPSVVINEEGDLVIIRQEMTDTFSSLCEDNNILFIDVSEAFEKSYTEDFSVPYGFSNTKMGTGHLNAAGHRIIAEELYKVLNKGD